MKGLAGGEVMKFRLVENLKGKEVGIRRRVMPRELTPVVLELFHKAIVRSEFLFEITIGMNVNDDGQATVEDHLHCAVEITQIIRRNPVGLPAPEHRLRIHAQPHVVESYRLDERD